jgi:DtxR family Mn-dependent transcriptional regulator
MLPSQTVENYLKTIYLAQAALESSHALVPMGHLAASVGVVPGTATTMVKTLAESGLVRYEPTWSPAPEADGGWPACRRSSSCFW